MTIAKANGVELAWDGFGDEADEAILLIAGLGTQMIRWTVPFCEELAARGYRVIRFDNRDTGGSTRFSACTPPDFGALVWPNSWPDDGRTCPIRLTTWRPTPSAFWMCLASSGRMSSAGRWAG
ncbi:MAG: alpha/beta hydrolase fold [Bradyrhizobium sp.]|nr:alpha/beta hydrolase fold [Bradyrhizobium sp.]